MAYEVDFGVADSWASGFTGSITVRNANPAAANGWTVEFFAPFTITSIWSAEIVSQLGGYYVVRNLAWNGLIAANGSVDFGFRATGAPTPPTDYTVNGQDVTDAPAPVLSISETTAIEGNSGTSPAGFTVTLSRASTESVTVAFATANGTAVAGDYVGRSGTMTFAPGQTSKTLNVSVRGDTLVEANENFTVKLSNAVGATIGKATGTATIINDDAAGLSLRVADVTLTEGTGGTKAAVLTVTLSAPANGAVAVSYQTGDGTAVAGADFTAMSGRLTFNPGQTTKSVSIPIATDGVFEANETFKFTLTNPSGATLSRAQATVTLTNDDAAPLPKLSVADVIVIEGDPVTTGGGGQGYFRTQGNDIVDAAGNDAKLAGVNWFGMESTRYAPDGLHVRNYQDMMDQMADLGFNAIRLPFSGQLFDAASRPNGIDYALNPDLFGLNGLRIMDRIIDYAGEIGIKIILDHHRPSAGAGASENGLWYDASYTEAKWIANWTMLATRYAGDSTVIGADLHNEPHKGIWGGGGATDWAAAAERAGNAVLAANPNLLIFVEGVESYQGNYYWWGGNLMGVKNRPIQLDVANRVVYSAHDYPNSIYPQPWFSDPNFANTLPAKFDQMWGYIERENIAPVFLGEFGSKLTDPKDLVWLDKITDYLAGDYDGNGTRDMPAGEQGVNWTWWSWNPNSGDTGGILKDDWRSVHENKVASLVPLMFDFGTGAVTTDSVTNATFRVTLSAASANTVTVNYATQAASATASDFTPVNGTLTFAPGQTSKTFAVKVRGDAVFEPDEAFRFVLSTPRNAEIADGVAAGRIVNDDAAMAARMVQFAVGLPAEPALSATTTIVDAWDAGGVASVVVKNVGKTAVKDWSVALETSLDITAIWNAEIEWRDKGDYTIGAERWNSRIAPGEVVTFGFQASGVVTSDAFEWSF